MHVRNSICASIVLAVLVVVVVVVTVQTKIIEIKQFVFSAGTISDAVYAPYEFFIV